MNKILLAILLLATTNSYATQIVTPIIFNNGDTVTASKLNGNQNAITNVVNGNIDNTNTGSGYKLFQIVATLPSAGNQGSVAFQTSDNTLNIDNGASWLATITPSGTLATGKIPYYNGGWQLLAPGSSGQALTSTGTSSLPTYQGMTTQGDVEYYNGSARTRLAPGTSGQFLETQGAAANPIWATLPVTAFVKVSNTQSSGTGGGTATSGSWINCILNAKDSDTGSIATLTSNQVSIPAGTYQVHATQSFFAVNKSQIRLENISDSSLILTGTDTFSDSAANTMGVAQVDGQFTLSGTKTISLQYQVQTTGATNGLGFPASFGAEVYSILELWKVS